jgi:7-cyano-7-deazaguanine synthase
LVSGAAAVILLSGGLDSVTVLADATARGHAVHALSFSYGQRHAVELACARRQARAFGAVAHEIVDLGHLGALVASATALVRSSEHAVPKGAPAGPQPSDGSAAERSPIPLTYVPARNTLFLAYALAWAEVLDARHIFIGVNALDYSGYPDCRPAFIDAFQRVADLGTRAGVEDRSIHIETPLRDLRKHEIVALGSSLGVDYGDTVSCYDPREDDRGPLACGRCESCRLRRAGFERAGVPDPTRYVEGHAP